MESITSAIDEEQKELLANPKLKKIKTIEKFIKKSLSKLDPRNLLIVRLKYNLIGLYGREQGFTSEVCWINTVQQNCFVASPSSIQPGNIY